MIDCVRCGKIATHHHKYCDECYPQKSATILTLKNDLKRAHRALLDLYRLAPAQRIRNCRHEQGKVIIRKSTIREVLKQRKIKLTGVNDEAFA